MMLLGGVSPKREMVGRLWLIDPVNHGADRTLCIKHYKLCFVQCTLQYTEIEYFHWNGNTTYTTKGHKIECKIKCTNWTSQSRDTTKRCFFVLWQHWYFTLFIRILCSFVQERVRLRGRGQSYDMDWGVARATRHVEIVPLPTWHTYTVTITNIHIQSMLTLLTPPEYTFTYSWGMPTARHILQKFKSTSRSPTPFFCQQN